MISKNFLRELSMIVWKNNRNLDYWVSPWVNPTYSSIISIYRAKRRQAYAYGEPIIIDIEGLKTENEVLLTVYKAINKDRIERYLQ
jgi:hypothetical protein